MMIQHGLVKKDGKVTGYRTPQSELYTGQLDWVNLIQRRNKDQLKEAERILDGWAFWMMQNGYGQSSLVNLRDKDFTNPFGSSVPVGVEVTGNTAKALRIFGSMREANQQSYVTILMAVHIVRDGDRSIERVIDKLRESKDTAIHGFNLRRYNRAKSAFANYLK